MTYALSGLVGALTFVTYGSVNAAWSNPALWVFCAYLWACIPAYSTLSNRLERWAAGRSGLLTGGRGARLAAQMGVNVVLLALVVWGGVVDSAGLVGMGGFMMTALWITLVSQGGQYLALRLAGPRQADAYVTVAVCLSATVTALAVSGVPLVQPVYVAASLVLGGLLIACDLMADLTHGRVTCQTR
jgi:hypothetical protein